MPATSVYAATSGARAAKLRISAVQGKKDALVVNVWICFGKLSNAA